MVPKKDGLVRDIYYIDSKPYTKYEVERLQSILNPYSSVDKKMLKILEEVSKALARIKYCVVGRAAVALYGRPLLVEDIEFLIDLSGVEGHELMNSLRKIEVSEDSLKRLINGNKVTIEKPSWGHRVVLIPATDEAQIMHLKGAKKTTILGLKLYMIPPEDLIARSISHGNIEDAAYLLTNLEIDDERLSLISRFLGVEKQVRELAEKVHQLKNQFKEASQ